MTLPRGVGTALSGVVAALLGGVLGLAWWGRATFSSSHDSRARTHPHRRRVLLAAAAVILVVLGVGIAWRTRVAFETVAACRNPNTGLALTSAHPSSGPALDAEEVITWPETGDGMLYGRIVSSSLCRYQPTDYYVDYHTGKIAGTRVVTVGDVTLAPPGDARVHSGTGVAQHEARHRTQWAVLAAVAGPLAFPVLYGVDDFFFPGNRNHFERLAGLESGDYQRGATGPVLGLPQVAALVVVGLAIAAWIYRRVRRRRKFHLL